MFSSKSSAACKVCSKSFRFRHLPGVAPSLFLRVEGLTIDFDVVVRDETLRDVTWSYPDPNPTFRSLRDHVAFYAWPFDGCFVDDERVTTQPGNFYGGWVLLMSQALSR